MREANSNYPNPSAQGSSRVNAAEQIRDKSENQGASILPSLTLPKGGGAIRGIGEKFAANPVTGTGSMTVPIVTSLGRSGFGPQLSLSYDSGAGNGPFGFGWSLSIPSITRKTDKGLPQYHDAEESDEFILSGAEDLVPIFKKDKNGNWVRDTNGDLIFDEKDRDGFTVRYYRPRIEGLFARIERWTNKTDATDVCWRSISKDNITTWYGRTKNSRIYDPAEPSRIFNWLICQSYDDKGNAIIYEYTEENSKRIFEDQYCKSISLAHERNRDDKNRSANRYLKHIKYGNRKPNRDSNWQATNPSLLNEWMFEVVFDYGEGHYTEQKATDTSHHDYASAQIEPPETWPVRQDPFSSYKAGFEVRTYRLCRSVLMFHHFSDELDGIDDYLVRSTEFTYDQSPIASFIKSVTQSGYKYDNTKGKYLKKSLPTLEFKYSQATINEEVEELDSESLGNLPIGIDGSKFQLVDLDGEGISGILTEQANAWHYKPNLGNGSFGQMEVVTTKPSLASLSSGRQQLLDLAGDGQLDLVDFHESTPGFYERTNDEQWENFEVFESLPNIVWDDPNLRFVDLNGDGHADILITENEAITWYPSLAENGFDSQRRVSVPLDEEDGPRLVFADGTQSIYLADMSGDGLTDLVRIRNGEVCYWPNFGYGKFGKKVTMNNAPWFDFPDQFDQKRIRIADIDGSGNTDIIYLHSDGISLYFNQSGNGWSGEKKLQQIPPIDNHSSIMTADILGDGTGCLVWSSPLPRYTNRQMKYIRLMKEGKPHLLIRTVNNLGAETHVQYAPSTKFYLADKEAGKPWITRLPFPVHVVERVETYDYISRNRFVTRYAYHHGYFDGEEREFRGFGMVEQWDTEQFATFEADGLLKDADNLNKASHIPPILTKTWFHTGAYIEGEKISRHFEDEYYHEPGLNDNEAEEFLLPDTILPKELITEEEREACRALKGSMLRQEVYALDKSEKVKHPYTVIEQNFTIRCLQPQGNNKHAVFLAHPHESISYHYERNPHDPRTGHQLTLEVDDYGNVLKSVSAGYGRKKVIITLDDQGRRKEIPNPGLSELIPDEQKKQTQILITYTESDYTNIIEENDSWRTPLPSEVRTYEITGLSPNNTQRFSWDELYRIDYDRMTDIPYESNATSGVQQKRIIECVRTLYAKDDQGGPLPVSRLDKLALPYETYKQAFSSGLLGTIFKNKANEQQIQTILESEGKYRDLDGDGNWWIPSGRQQFDKSIFYLPVKYYDPLGNTYSIDYDDFSLLMKGTQDPLGNSVTSENDYRILQPCIITDPNGNRSQAAFDVLGMVAGTAVMGTTNENVGDNLDGFVADPYQQEIDDFFIDPKGTKASDLLQGATTRIIYDLQYYVTNGKPVYAATIAREKHVSELGRTEESKLQVSFSYSDGFGREIQKKIRAEFGLVPKRDSNRKILVDAHNQPLMTYQPVMSRWVGNGWTIFNNKGKPIRQYEPFFTDTYQFEFDVRIGVSTILIYDPVDRVITTLHPNHTYEKVVFDAWKQTTWDVNDTVISNPANDDNIKGLIEKIDPAEYQPTWYEIRKNDVLSLNRWPDAENPKNPDIRKWEKQAAQKASVHAGTPKVAYFDTLGRAFLTIEHNKYEQKKNGTTTVIEEKYRTNVELDIEGNQHWVKDALGRIVMKYDYDMLSTVVHQHSMEAGERWMLNNVAGKEIYRWNSRGFRVCTKYDELVRPLEVYMKDNANPEIIVERFVYGEYHPDQSLKLRTRLYQHFDQSGVVTSTSYDFKGNLLEGKRQYAGEYKTYTNWITLKDCNDIDEIKNRANSRLADEEFISSTRYDALNRPIQMVTPHTDELKPNVIQPGYNEANLLETIDVWIRLSSAPDSMLDAGDADQHIVTNIDYNAKGQRSKIEYGNNTATSYDYDFETYRLKNLYTTRGTNTVNQEMLQDLFYTYDPTGNITYIQDDAQETIYFNGTVVEPHSDYNYDAIYRLIKATGREHVGQTNGAQNGPTQPADDDSFFINLQHPHDGNAMDRYTESYEYDFVGNIMKMIHQAGQGSWTRSYAYNETSLIEANNKSNRLSATSMPGDDENGPYRGRYTHDEHGNMTTMPHLPLMMWDYKDQLWASSQQIVTNGGKPETTWYIYDATGQRVRKITEAQATAGETPKRMKERFYLGAFEIYREYDTDGTTVTLERESLSVMDDKKRMALIETKTFETGLANRLRNLVTSPKPLIRYQYDNHLGSACLELDEEAKFISYEEYFPYGCTSLQSVDSQREVPAKRYHYTGKERDEESGVYYQEERYYAPWLGIWCSCDPAGIISYLNLFNYALSNPIKWVDTNGKSIRSPDLLSPIVLLRDKAHEAVVSSPASLYILGAIYGSIEAFSPAGFPTPQDAPREFERSRGIAQTTVGVFQAAVGVEGILQGGTMIGAAGVGEVITVGGATPVAVPVGIAGAAVATAGIGLLALGMANMERGGKKFKEAESKQSASGKKPPDSPDKPKLDPKKVYKSEPFKSGGVEYQLESSGKNINAFNAADPGAQVYVVKNFNGEVIYVGYTERDSLTRLGEHLAKQPGEFLGQASKVEIVGQGLLEREARALEEDLIQCHGPAFNNEKTPYQNKYGELPNPDDVRNAYNTFIEFIVKFSN